MYKYYFNPFRPTFLSCSLNEDAPPWVSSMHFTQEDLLTSEEVVQVLDKIYLTTKCFGRYDFYNKWFLYSPQQLKEMKAGKDKEKILSRLRKIMLRVSDMCIKCPFQEKCSNARMSISELITYWDEGVFPTKAEQFICGGKGPWM